MAHPNPHRLILTPLFAGDRRAGAGFDINQHDNDPEHANAVVGWLLFLARSLQGLGRLVALRLLALVNNAIEADSLLVRISLHRKRWCA